jgi:hypothetical protein
MLVLAFALVGGFSMPRAAWAICYCDPNEPYSSTSLHWSMGASCSEVQNDLLAQTANEAYGICGGSTQTCLGSLIANGCYWTGEYWDMSGYREYKCKTCEPRPPREPY